jgi:hypothetical protein
VGIQLGIGGLKPFAASFVDKKKFGDCKALSNYMQAMLNTAGIKSYQALINAGYNRLPVDSSFAHDEFDHVILCVPNKGDTIWLECTSRDAPFGIPGSFTENRRALLITEEGGVMVSTPKSDAKQNQFHTTTTIQLTEEGGGTAGIQWRSTGAIARRLKDNLLDDNADEQKDYLMNRMGFKQPDEFTITPEISNTEPMQTSLKMIFEKIPDFSTGSKLFLPPRVYKFWSRALPKTENRKTDYYFEYPFISSDTTRYILPEGFTVETLPKGQNLTFGNFIYKSSYAFDKTNKTIIIYCTLVLSELRIPATRFAEARLFFNEILKDDTQRIIVRKE